MRKRILVPLDGTEISMRSLEYVEDTFNKSDAQITLLIVMDDKETKDLQDSEKERGLKLLEKAENELHGYKVNNCVSFGDPGKEIIKKASSENVDCVIMAKTDKLGFSENTGSVTVQVLRKAKCAVTVIP